MKDLLIELNADEINNVCGGVSCHILRLALGAISGFIISGAVYAWHDAPARYINDAQEIAECLNIISFMVVGFCVGAVIGYHLIDCKDSEE